MGKINIGINGFGRIGRTVFRLLSEHEDLNVVAINDLADAKTLAHLVKYDSIHGPFAKEILAKKDTILFNGKAITVLTWLLASIPSA